MSTIAIIHSTRDGIPVEARCDGCGQVWTRPAGDPSVTTLALFVLDHRYCRPPEAA